MVEKYDRTFRVSQVLIPDDVILSLENSATSLWNAVIFAMRMENNTENKKVFCSTMLFSTLLLSIHEAVCQSNEGRIRILKCFLKYLKFCNDDNFADLIPNGVENADKCLRVLEESKEKLTSKQMAEFNKLKIELFMTNFQLALGNKDLKMAQFYESKANIKSSVDVINAELVLELCRVIYNSVLSLRNSEPEIKVEELYFFLQCAVEYLNLPVSGLKQHPDYSNTRYTLLLFLANLMVESDELDVNLCSRYLDIIQNDYPNKIESFKLAIKFNDKTSSLDTNSREEILMRMIMSVNVSVNFDSILGCINDQAKFDSLSAIRCLDYLFLNKIDATKDQTLLERAATTRVFIITQALTMENAEKIESLEHFFAQYERIISQEPSKAAISSLVTLLFNTGKKLQKAGNPQDSIGWFNLALKDIISSGYEDKAKVQRALKYAYLETANHSGVKSVYNEMEERDKIHPLTKLIMFKVFIAENNEDEALKCLQHMKESENPKSVDTLILGIVDCKNSTELAIKAMLLLFQKLEKDGTNGKDMPIACSLRYTIQLILKLCEKEQAVFNRYLPTFEHLLNKGFQFLNTVKILNSVSAPKINAHNEVISSDDLEWFASVSYNIGVKCTREENYASALKYSELAVNFISLMALNDFIPSKRMQYEYWRYRCITLSLMAKKNSANNESLSSFTETYSQLFNELAKKLADQDFLNLADEELKERFRRCLFDILIIAYEVAIQTRNEQFIHQIMDQSAKYQNGDLDSALVNYIVPLDDFPKPMLSYILTVLIERNITTTRIDDITLLTWTRLLIENSISTSEQTCLRIINELHPRMRSSTDYNTPAASQELECITTSIWNQGVTDIAEENRLMGEKWCRKAIQLASLFNNRLEEHLAELWSSLNSDLSE
ncbi:Spo22p Ecym_8023 [Eremothecium cymbalariae DBVPG|uniref:Protein ZIP4 homolog n=1 Tax=Eremothecium cymbalariae (strain CBS 270.75 / DBVPG 7215 / KCTC 17166 / NRRL Y-17582) TaxID=931890 RepID=G8JWU5_ERECY|nr:Hypothetical protein Ecym_8023 [Eremothecium cymbalariae DBVPG\